MRKTSRITLAILPAFWFLGASVAWAGDEGKAAATESSEGDVEKVEKAIEKKAEEKFHEVTYEKGEKPGDIYEDTANPCAGKAPNPCAAKAPNPCAGRE